MKLKLVKGTRDLTGESLERFRLIEEEAKRVLALYGYKEIRLPLMENVDLFSHGIGEETDIVGKEMFLLRDRRQRCLALRPESTAQVVRHVINNNTMRQNRYIKYFYAGPMFRYEQPQKGRHRQFYQIGAEYFGVPTPDADLETILILRHLFRSINLDGVSFQINTIGCLKPECRPNFKKKLVRFFSEEGRELCEDCKRRLNSNPLRILDCKNDRCASTTADAPKIREEVCSDCAGNFAELRNLLERHGVVYTLNDKLVRGLDYYSRTVFEVYAENLGAQNAAGGGGRYDGLFEVFGAETVPAIGFALGLDRLTLLMDSPETKQPDLFVVGRNRPVVAQTAASCREAGFECHYDPFLSSMKSQFRQANKLKARLSLILGEKEIENGRIAVKDMQTGSQEEIAQNGLLQFLQSRLKYRQQD